jgi:ubiquinone biosynthesis UbiH/UbiF/VisC/COQ6 family hydroxylase
MNELSTEILIVGGGITGLIMARLLIPYFKVILIDKYSNINIETKPKYISINNYSYNFLQELKLSNLLLNINKYDRIYISHYFSNKNITFDACDINMSQLGYIVDTSELLKIIKNDIESKKNIYNFNYLYSETVNSCMEMADGWVVSTMNNLFIKANLIIGADGTNSFIRKSIGISTKSISYKQNALITNISLEKPHFNIARQIFLPSGPIAFLPLLNKYECTIVWSINNYYQTDNQYYQLLMKKYIPKEYGNIKILNDFQCFPLFHHHAKSYVKNHSVIIGDAAHTIHPLGGLGMNLALSDINILGNILISQKKINYSLAFAIETLKLYEYKTKIHNHAIYTSMNILHNLFTHNKTLGHNILNLGFHIFNNMKLLKILCMKIASENILL